MSDPARNLNWSSLKDFLAVAECGSLSEAARRYGVSQPTLTRRIAALESSLGAELFRRSPRGLELTEAGEAVVEPARQMEREAQALELAVSGRDRALAGTVRITATEGLAVEWLTPALADFREQHPRIDLEIIVRNTALNVLRREADIAIRLGRPQQMELVTRRVGELVLGLYASRAYLEELGTPRTRDELAEHRGVAFDEVYVYTAVNRVGIDVLRFRPDAPAGERLERVDRIQTPGDTYSVSVRPNGDGSKTLLVSDGIGGYRFYGYTIQ